MNPVMRKLKSKRGASMLLAMMFMAFCVFVGGSVLSAAVANGSRVAKQSENQQEYLRQRSAALVIADELKGHPDDQLQMIVEEKVVTISSSDSEESQVKTTYTFQLFNNDEPKTKFQKMLYEMVVQSYLPMRPLPKGVDAKYSNFYFKGMLAEEKYSDEKVEIYPNPGILSITDPMNSCTMQYSMNSTYDFQAIFVEAAKDENGNSIMGENGNQKYNDVSKIHLFLNANVGTSEPVVVETSKEELIVEGSGENMTTSTKVTTTKTTTTTTIIRWDDPVIRKGGA